MFIDGGNFFCSLSFITENGCIFHGNNTTVHIHIHNYVYFMRIKFTLFKYIKCYRIVTARTATPPQNGCAHCAVVCVYYVYVPQSQPF